MRGSHDTPASALSGEETPTPGNSDLDSAMGELVKAFARQGCAAAVHAPRGAEDDGWDGPEGGPAYPDDGPSYRTRRARDGDEGGDEDPPEEESIGPGQSDAPAYGANGGEGPIAEEIVHRDYFVLS